MLKQLKNNNNGVVFVTVLMIIIVMIILTISIVSMNVNQVLVSEAEVKRIQAEILAMGALARTFANQSSDSPADYISYEETLDDVTFTVESQVSPCAGCPFGTDSLTINISY